MQRKSILRPPFTTLCEIKIIAFMALTELHPKEKALFYLVSQKQNTASVLKMTNYVNVKEGL